MGCFHPAPKPKRIINTVDQELQAKTVPQVLPDDKLAELQHLVEQSVLIEFHSALCDEVVLSSCPMTSRCFKLHVQQQIPAVTNSLKRSCLLNTLGENLPHSRVNSSCERVRQACEAAVPFYEFFNEVHSEELCTGLKTSAFQHFTEGKSTDPLGEFQAQANGSCKEQQAAELEELLDLFKQGNPAAVVTRKLHSQTLTHKVFLKKQKAQALQIATAFKDLLPETVQTLLFGEPLAQTQLPVKPEFKTCRPLTFLEELTKKIEPRRQLCIDLTHDSLPNRV